LNNFIISDLVGHAHTTGSIQLNQVGEKLFGELWDGALGRNEVQQKYKGGVALVNMDKKQYGQASGTHWVCLVKGHFYDPLMPNGKEMDIEQGDNEQNCGQRCLAFALLYLQNPDMAKLV